MKVFVAGATGVAGRRAVPALAAAGHEVVGVARSDDKAALLRRLGATPASVDLFDAPALTAAVAGCDAVVNLATSIPPPARAALPGAWSENDRLRSEASRTLVDAALAAGASRYVQESIAFVYPDHGDRWIDEDVALDPPPLARSVLAAEAQAGRVTDAGGAGVVLRFGQFYAPDSTHSLAMVRMLRMRLPALPGPRRAYGPALSADDAAGAVVAALDAPAGTWNVTDDEPLTREAFNAAFAEALGVKPPRGTGTTLLRASANTRFYLRSQRVANGRFKEATGWAPRAADAATGLRAMVAAMAGGRP